MYFYLEVGMKKPGFKIINFKVSGIKNIENEIKIKFLNETLNSSKVLNVTNKRIKAIYGTNGSGKTAIITAVDLYRNICIYPAYILKEEVINNLDSIINCITKSFKFEIVFAYTYDERVESIYKHEIEIDKGFASFYELKEKLYIAQDIYNSNGTYTLIFDNSNGEIKGNEKIITQTTKTFLERQTLITSSVSSLIIPLIFYNSSVDNKKNIVTLSENGSKDFIKNVFNLNLFSQRIKVYLDIKDKHQYKDPYYAIKNKINNKDIPEDILSLLKNDSERFYYTSLEDTIQKSEYDEYRNKIKKIYEFIKIVKPTLKEIKITKKDFGQFYKCRKSFEYDSGLIDLEYESTGIKKMVELYEFISSAFDGDIVFVDEIDANISGVFLDKLLHCLEQNGKGQLCFTSHNIYSMNKIKSFVTITTIGETGQIFDIRKNGNTNPSNAFYNGDIPDSPFNIYENDFYKIFVDE